MIIEEADLSVANERKRIVTGKRKRRWWYVDSKGRSTADFDMLAGNRVPRGS